MSYVFREIHTIRDNVIALFLQLFIVNVTRKWPWPLLFIWQHPTLWWLSGG